MGPFEMVVAIVLIGAVAGVVRSKHRAAEAGGASSADLQAIRDQIARIERRLQSLETLATDPAARLAADIDRLRDSARSN